MNISQQFKGIDVGVRACGKIKGNVKFLSTNLKQDKIMVLSIMSRIILFTVNRYTTNL